MEIIDRDELKADPTLKKLYEVIKSKHVVPDFTIKTLMENRHVKDFCEESKFFVVLGDDNDPIFMHYDVANWYKDKSVLVKIERIGIYKDFLEYDVARMKGIHSTKDSDIPNIN